MELGKDHVHYTKIMFIVDFIVLPFTVFSNGCGLLVRKEEKNLKCIKCQSFS